MPEIAETADVLRPRLAEMIDLRHWLAMLASRLPWAQIEAALAAHLARQVPQGRALAQDDLFVRPVRADGRRRPCRSRSSPTAHPSHGPLAVPQARLQVQR